jgi:hypothetical protein
MITHSDTYWLRVDLYRPIPIVLLTSTFRKIRCSQAKLRPVINIISNWISVNNDSKTILLITNEYEAKTSLVTYLQHLHCQKLNKDITARKQGRLMSSFYFQTPPKREESVSIVHCLLVTLRAPSQNCTKCFPTRTSLTQKSFVSVMFAYAKGAAFSVSNRRRQYNCVLSLMMINFEGYLRYACITHTGNLQRILFYEWVLH